MALPPTHPEPTDDTPTSSTIALPLRQYCPRRFILVGLCFLSTFICYIDRVNMSVAIIPMAEEFKWAQTTKGIILPSHTEKRKNPLGPAAVQSAGMGDYY
jgi:hypothetical protein